MSNEEIYDNDVDMEVGDEDGASAGFLDNDFEVELKRRAPKGDVFFQIYPRTRHWIHLGVRPETILREDKSDNIFSFEKTMKDSSYPAEEGKRYVSFTCNIILTELELRMSFSRIKIRYSDLEGVEGQEFSLANDGEECADVTKLCESVIDNLATYLSKS